MIRRRSSVWKLTAPTLAKVRRSAANYKLPHQVCGNCGYYKGKDDRQKGSVISFPQEERERSFSFLFLPQKEAGRQWRYTEITGARQGEVRRWR